MANDTDKRTVDDSARPAPDDDRPRARLIDRLSSFFRQRSESSLRENLEDALSEDVAGTEAFSASERAMLNNILRLREVRVEDVMIPRADISRWKYPPRLASFWCCLRNLAIRACRSMPIRLMIHAA